MREETRQHYGLEAFWQNAPLIESLREHTSDGSRQRVGSEAG
jgi:hypothetical protein